MIHGGGGKWVAATTDHELVLMVLMKQGRMLREDKAAASKGKPGGTGEAGASGEG
jgi:hypothetical protein